MPSKIGQINKQLDSLIDSKCELEEKALKIIKNVDQLTCNIEHAERDVEKALRAKLSKECQGRMNCEICRLKEEKKRAEKILCMYDQSLKLLSKQLKNCTGKGNCKKI